MRRAIGLAAVCALIVAVRLAMPSDAGAEVAAMALGFVLLVSFVLGRAVTRLGLPAISGYILVGLVSGPYLLGWLHPAFAVLGHSAVASLRLVDGVALGLIALTAGGELKLSALRRHARTIASVIAAQVLLVFGGIVVAGLALQGWLPLLGELSPPAALAALLLVGVIALTNSPAVALAVLQELRPRGPVSEIVLAIVVVNDVVVIALFSVVLALGRQLVSLQSAWSLGFLVALGWETAGSVLLGLALGWLVARTMRHVGHELPLLILGVAFVAVAVLPALHLSGVLALTVAGFAIENFSPHGDDLIRAIERHSLPVYVVFFTISGADLDLQTLARIWPLALGVAVLRGALVALGSWAGGRIAGATPSVCRWAWSGLVPQAGVALGLVLLIPPRLPQVASTLIVAVIALNQLAGPVLFRLGLFRSGEARPDSPERDMAAGPA